MTGSVTVVTDTVGAVVSMVYVIVDDAVESLPAASWTALAAIWIVSVPSLFGAPRLTVNVYGPEPLPDEAPLAQADDVPPMVTSVVVALKPETVLLKVTEQLKLVLFDGVVLGVQLKALTVGPWRSTVTEAGEPATTVWALPAVSLTEKVPALVRLLTPVLPAVIDDVAEMVQVGVPVPVTDVIEVMLPKVKSVPLAVETVAQFRFLLPVRVKVRLVELVGFAGVVSKVSVGLVVSIV